MGGPSGFKLSVCYFFVIFGLFIIHTISHQWSDYHGLYVVWCPSARIWFLRGFVDTPSHLGVKSSKIPKREREWIFLSQWRNTTRSSATAEDPATRYLYTIRGLSRWPRGVADVDGRGSGGRHHTGGKQTMCEDRLWGQHGVWLTTGAPGGQATIERRRTVGQTCKTTAQIEPKSRYFDSY